MSGSSFIEKISKSVMFKKKRVKAGTNYESPGSRWIPKLVEYK